MGSSERPCSGNASLCPSPVQSRMNKGDEISPLQPLLPPPPSSSPSPLPPTRKSAPAIPRRSSVKRRSFPTRPTLPPKVGSKKRKPRPNSIVMAANSRLQADTMSPVDEPPTPLDPTLRRLMERMIPPPPPPPPLPSIGSASSLPLVSDSKRKGLRHFAVRVCKKVEESGTTTYNQVADELVNEERINRAVSCSSANCSTSHSVFATLVDEKNIRRRVYDSLNVLIAMGILGRDKKSILWKGLGAVRRAPSVVEDLERIRKQVEEKRQIVKKKEIVLNNLRRRNDLICALINKRRAEEALMVGSIDDASSPLNRIFAQSSDLSDRITFPFIILQCSNVAQIELVLSEDRTEAEFTFRQPFVALGYSEILSRLPLSFGTALSNGMDFTWIDGSVSHSWVVPSSTLSLLRNN